MARIFRLAASLLCTLAVLVCVQLPASALSVIASDSFNRTVTGGWGSADVGGPWTVLDTAGSWSVTPGQAASACRRRAAAGGAGQRLVQDVDLLAELTLPRCTGSATTATAT